MICRFETRWTVRALVCSAIALVASEAWPQQAAPLNTKPIMPAAPHSQANALVETKRTTRFSFSRAPWKEVLQFLAANANLSLHIGELPSGSFTYTDSRAYTPNEAIDRINLFLIPQRFVLVRSDELLSVIALDDEAGVRQLDAIAELVQPDDLDRQSGGQLAKCLFPVGNAEPDQALQELGGLLLMREPVLLKNTNQLLVTDTVGKLLLVRQILTRLSSTPNAIGPIKRFLLGELDAEQVLNQIRPHVGLEPLAMTGTDISISVDPSGRQLLVSGSEAKVRLVEGAMKSIQSNPHAEIAQAARYFRPHRVGTADLQTVSNVLQTLLVDQDVRLAADVKSNQIAVMATDDVHELVDKTIQQLCDADAVEFKAISLRSLDLRYAVALLNAMFGGTDPPDAKATGGARPRIEADPSTGRLFVRAKASQIDEIERVLAQLGEPAQSSESPLRLLPYPGDRGRRILDAAERFWPDSESLLILPSWQHDTDQPQERAVTPSPRRQEETDQPKTSAVDVQPSPAACPRSNAPSKHVPIRAQLTPKGILIRSSNLDELDRFEQHLRMVAGAEGSSEMRLAVFYLKHATATEADRLLRRWLDAESASAPTYGNTVTMNEAGGASGWSIGTTTIFADSRLNRLFVYGLPDDLAKMERQLKIIDRENSLTELSTHGTPRVIQLRNANVLEVAKVVRDAYEGRIAATADERRQAAQQSQRPQNGPANPRTDQAPAQSVAIDSSASSSDQPRMTLATDLKSNSLIVTAPSQFADEVERLALRIDSQSELAVRVVTLNSSATDKIHTALTNILGDRVQTARPTKAETK